MLSMSGRRIGRLRFAAAALVVGLLMLGTEWPGAGPLASVAQAQSQSQQNRARQLYSEAQALFDSGRYAAAEASFRAAYDAVPNPVVLRAIAASQERQGNIAQAVATLQQYLREAPNASDRAEVERRVQELSARPASLAIGSTPPGARISIDGQDTGLVTPADVTLPAGEHTLELHLEGHQPVSQTVTAQAATRMRLDVPLQAGADADALGSEGGDGQVAVDEPGTTSSDPSAGVWVTAGVAAAALVSGTVFGFLALSEQSNFDSEPNDDTADRGEIFALVADISFGVAAAAAITAIVLYIVERSGSGSSDAETASNDLQLDVAPWADASGGGMAAQLRF